MQISMPPVQNSILRIFLPRVPEGSTSWPSDANARDSMLSNKPYLSPQRSVESERAGPAQELRAA